MADFARSVHPGVQSQLDRLSKLSPAGDRLGLERITAVLDRLGRPQDKLPPVLHVAGTNGKGSTVAFLRAALEASGHSVHAFTIPHLVRGHLLELKRRHLVVSRRGKFGGYLLARPAAEITFAEIIRVIDGPLALAPCVSKTAFRKCDDCPDLATCALREALLRARDASAEVLEAYSLKDAAMTGAIGL